MICAGNHSDDGRATSLAKLRSTKEPYVLKFATDDVRGRLRAGDLLLMSQDVSPAAEISIVKCGQDLLLAPY